MQLRDSAGRKILSIPEGFMKKSNHVSGSIHEKTFFQFNQKQFRFCTPNENSENSTRNNPQNDQKLSMFCLYSSTKTKQRKRKTTKGHKVCELTRIGKSCSKKVTEDNGTRWKPLGWLCPKEYFTNLMNAT